LGNEEIDIVMHGVTMKFTK